MLIETKLIFSLQVTVKELAAANQMQEQSLIDANERMQMLEKRSMTSDDALGKIKMLLSAQERGKNRMSRQVMELFISLVLKFHLMS